MRGRGLTIAAIIGAFGLTSAAGATAAPKYHSPGYKGTTKAPKVQTPPPPTPIELGTGHAPQVLVDNAGTAHITWSEGRGDAADAVRYCRLKRTSTTCDPLLDLVPAQTGPRASDEFNVEYGTPRILTIGDQLVVLTSRYPNSVAGPDGQERDTNTYLFISDNGGASFQPGVQIGDGPTSGQPAVFGPPETPRIGLISDTVTGGTFFQAISGARFETRTANLGPDGVDSALVAQGTSLLASWSTIGDVIHIRRWDGAGDVMDPNAWSDTTLPGSGSRMVGGPAGVFLLSRDGAGADLGVRRIDGITPGARGAVSGTRNSTLHDLAEDPSGQLLVSYLDATADGAAMRLRASVDGASFSAAQTLLEVKDPTLGVWSTDLAATADGGGFAVAHEGVGGAEGPIVALPFGSQAATNQPGLAGVPGSGLDPDTVSTCQQLAFGNVSIRSGGCLLPSAANRNIRVAEDVIKLNGLEVVPEGSAKIILDAKRTTLDTTGTVRVQLRAPGITPIVLFRGELHINLKDEQAQARAAQAGGGTCTGQRLAAFNADTDLKGFPIKGSIAVFLSGESSCVPVSLEMPKAFGGVRGDAILRADNARGLHVDSLHIGVDNAFIGPVLLQDLAIDYQSEGEIWNGKATLGLPPQPGGAKLGAQVRFAGGQFQEGHLQLDFPYPGIALDPFAATYLNRVSGGFGIDPLFVEVGAGFGVIPIPPNLYTFEIDGNLRVTFADPVTFDFTGNGKMLGFDVADERILVTTDGLAKVNANVNLDLDVASVTGGIAAFVDVPAKRFSGKISGRVCVGICTDAAAVISTRGVGACTPIGGFGHFWNDPILDTRVMVLDCDISDYEEPTPAGRARAAQAGGLTVTVPGGQRVVNIRVTGAGGPPQVVLVSPGGERITPGVDPNGPALAVSGADRTFIGVREPAAGTWTIEPVAGSPAVTGVALATAVPAPKVSAKLGGRGAKRTLTYQVSTGDGLATTFIEQGASGGRVIGTARGARGTLRFTPSPGPGGPRQIVAQVSRNGLPRLEQTVATYTAPRPTGPARVRGLGVKRAGRGVTVRWRRASGAHAYAVRIDLPNGQSLLKVVGAKQTRVRVGGAPRKGKVRVSVAAVDASGRRGAAASATAR
jgi:hypothetical protein